MDRNPLISCAAGHLGAAAFTALFSAVYEHFGHGVWSAYMIFAFAIPLLLGALPAFILLNAKKEAPPSVSVKLWNCGIASFTVGSLFQGVLEIYGTTNRLIIVYPVVGAVLTSAAVVTRISTACRARSRR